MANSKNHDHLSTDDPHHLRQYLVRAVKAYFCVLCWFAIAAGLLMYGPPAVSVSPDADGVVGVIFGVMLSAGSATVLTIVLAVGVLAGIDRIRRSGEQDEPDATDGVEDETHA
jgi:hypothetical protein